MNGTTIADSSLINGSSIGNKSEKKSIICGRLSPSANRGSRGASLNQCANVVSPIAVAASLTAGPATPGISMLAENPDTLCESSFGQPELKFLSNPNPYAHSDVGKKNNNFSPSWNGHDQNKSPYGLKPGSSDPFLSSTSSKYHPDANKPKSYPSQFGSSSGKK